VAASQRQHVSSATLAGAYIERLQMKILMQLLSSHANLPGMLRTIGPHLEAVASEGTTFEVAGTMHGGLADDFRTFETLDVIDAIRSVVFRPPGSFDVVAIGNSLDAGLAELRELLAVPVLAYLETNLAMSAMAGDRVALLVPTNAFVARYRQLVRMYGYESRCAGVYSLGFDRVPAMNALFDDDPAAAGAAAKQLLAVAEEAAERSGADVLLPCGPPALLLATRRVHAVGSATVLDGFAILAKLAEAVGGLARGGYPFVARGLVNRSLGDDLRLRAVEALSAAL
jgi:Asp/Glu/hydantoin racemase